MRIWAIKGPESCALQKIKRLCKDVTFKYCVFTFLSLLNMKEIGGTSITSYFQGIPRDGMKRTTKFCSLTILLLATFSKRTQK